MSTRLLILLPAHGHGGCEYGALGFAVFAAHTIGLDVVVAVPRVPETAFLAELCAVNHLRSVDLGLTFEADDDEARFGMQQRRCEAMLAILKPDAVFLPMPWPARGTGLIAGCAAAGVSALVKFALVPDKLYGPPETAVEAAARAQRTRQIWFANSRHSAKLIESHWRLPVGSVDYFHVGPIGLAGLVPDTQETIGPAEAREGVREELGLAADAVILVTIGRLASQKGYETYVEAAATLAAADPRLHFLWVGEGELRPALEAAIAAKGLAGRVTLAGFRRDVRRLLRGSDIFVLPTLYEGGCSQALLEAMEEGLPTVVSRTSAVGEVARDGEEALLVMPGDPEGLRRRIARLVGDSALRTRLGKAAARRAKVFSRRMMFAETLLRLDRLLGTRLRRHPALDGIVLAGDTEGRKPAPQVAETIRKILTTFAISR